MKASKLNFKSLSLVVLAIVAVFATSCNKEDFSSSYHSSYFEDTELKRGKAVNLQS